MGTIKIERFERAGEPVVRVSDLAYLVWERPDLDTAEAFLIDFGLQRAARHRGTLYMRGAGIRHHVCVVEQRPEPRFIGPAFEAAAREDLERLAALPGASEIETIRGPGGGERVVLADPSGFRVEVVHAIAELDPLPVRAPLVANSPWRKARINAAQRADDPPPSVLRLGHCVLSAVEIRRTVRWYMDTLGLIPSDVLHLPDGSPALVFLRCDRGDDPAGHHSLALVGGIDVAYLHSGYEVVDLDAVALGHVRLEQAGYSHVWGLGRHRYGSEIFDYWKDPWGAVHEHYTDGDVFDAEQPTAYHPLARRSYAQWGPPMPDEMAGRHELTLRRMWRLARNLWSSEELTVARVRALEKTLRPVPGEKSNKKSS